MPNAIVEIAATVALLLAAGFAIGLADRRGFACRWLFVAAALVLGYDALLTRGYRLLPNLFEGHLNWEGKLLALAGTLAVAALPAFGWRRVGLTFGQKPGSLRPALIVAGAYCLFVLGLALVLPDDPFGAEDLAFQLTLPGIGEELFYRGVLLFALDRAFAGRLRLFGVDWGWGAVLTSLLFGLAHAFGYGRHGFGFDPVTMALTTLPSFVAVWVRLRTGSLLLPVAMHNFGNTVALFA